MCGHAFAGDRCSPFLAALNSPHAGSRHLGFCARIQTNTLMPNTRSKSRMRSRCTSGSARRAARKGRSLPRPQDQRSVAATHDSGSLHPCMAYPSSAGNRDTHLSWTATPDRLSRIPETAPSCCAARQLTTTASDAGAARRYGFRSVCGNYASVIPRYVF